MNQELYSYFDAEILEEGRVLLNEKRQRSFRQELTADGRLRLYARYPDRFNFVDRAQMILSADSASVDSARCDCTGRSTVSFCKHCAALLLRLEQEEPVPTAGAAGEKADCPSADEVSSPEEIQTDDEGDPRPKIRDLTYSFLNCPQHLYPGISEPEIPLERFETVFGKNFLARKLHDKHRKWNGSCFGMVSSSSLFYHPGNNVSVPDYRRGASVPAQLQLSDWNRGLDMTLHAFIEAIHITQFGDVVSDARNATYGKALSERLKDLCEQVEAFEATGMSPVIIDLYWIAPDKKCHGHSVLPFRHEQLDQFRSRLHIYDPNVPEKVRFCDLRRDGERNYQSWRFLMDDNTTEISSERGDIISYLSHKDFQGAWDHRGTPPIKALFTTACSDLMLLDETGSAVLKISGGCMTALRDDVLPVWITDGGDDEAVLECWMNPGSYRVINEDPEQLLSFSFTSQNGAVEVETESSEALCTLDDADDIQKIQIVEKGKPFTARLFSFVREVFLKALSSLGCDLLLQGGKVLLHLVTAEDVTEFQVDGEDADVNDYLETEDQELREPENEEWDEEELLCTNKPANPAGPEPAAPGEG